VSEKALKDLVGRCEELCFDLELTSVSRWKEEHPGARAIGYMPIYVPREIVHAAGMLPVGVLGGGDRTEIIRGDAYFQSYICHIPRSTIELGLAGKLDLLDGMLFPSICDVIRNLSGMWKLLFPDRYVKYFDVPQNFSTEVGGRYYRKELEGLKSDLEGLSGGAITDEALERSIGVYNENRRLCREVFRRRSETPWKIPTAEAYLVLRAGSVLPVEEHNRILESYLEYVEGVRRKERDKARVIVTGAFCEQPPLGLIRTLERAGCYIVDDDFMLASRWHTEDIPRDGDPLGALVEAFLHHSVSTASIYEPNRKGEHLVDSFRRHRAEGVIFCAASFCDPALLDRPMLQAALDREGISYTSFKYSEDTGQFGVIREQAGTFADSIKLWSPA
jgi:benzoyl-CoA reductase subunit C